jgi:hypothetical protein
MRTYSNLFGPFLLTTTLLKFAKMNYEKSELFLCHVHVLLSRKSVFLFKHTLICDCWCLKDMKGFRYLKLSVHFSDIYTSLRRFPVCAHNQLTPWSRVLLKKPRVHQLLENFPTFYEIRRFVTVFARASNCSLS